MKGAGEVVKEQGEDVANTVAQGVGNVLEGLSRGLDKSLVQKEIRLDDSVASLVAVNRAQRIDRDHSDERQGLSLYVVSEVGMKQKLMLLAYVDGKEVGRSIADVALDEKGTSYVDFEFDARTQLGAVEFYVLKLAG